MWSRLKQNVKEKTGRAVATKLPEQLEADMNYYLEWEKRDKALVKQFGEVIESFADGKKRYEIMSTLEVLGCTIGGPIAEGSSALCSFMQERTIKEKKAYDKASAILKARCDTFAAAELAAVVETCNRLKKKRLTRDAAESDYRSKPTDDKKAKFDAADAEFKKYVKAVEEYGAKIPLWDSQHKANFVETVKALGVAFEVR